jgi:hypothetical protein
MTKNLRSQRHDEEGCAPSKKPKAESGDETTEELTESGDETTEVDTESGGETTEELPESGGKTTEELTDSDNDLPTDCGFGKSECGACNLEHGQALIHEHDDDCRYAQWYCKRIGISMNKFE